MFTIAPCPARCMCGTAARHSHMGAVRFTRSAASQYSLSMSATRASFPSGLATALFTSPVSPPSRSAAASTSVLHAPSDPRSAGTNSARPPAAAIASTTALPRDALRPCTTTRAPSSAYSTAIAFPIPDVEPVTRACSSASRTTGGYRPRRRYAGGDEAPPWTRRFIAWTAGVLALLTVVGLVALWPGEDVRSGRRVNLPSEVYSAVVVRVHRGPCKSTVPSDDVTCDRVRFRLEQGPDEGETRSIDFPLSASSPHFDVGDGVVLSRQHGADPGFDYQFADRQRRSSLLWLAVLFAVAVALLGRLRGLAALVGLVASIGVLLVFVLPAILEGASPVLVAIVGSSAIAYLALYLAHGLRTMTSVALLGTLAALALTVGLAALFTELAHFTGLASEEAILVTVGTKGIDLQGLVLAGMVARRARRA